MSDRHVARALRSNADFSTAEGVALMLLADDADDDGKVRAVSEEPIAEDMRIKPADVQGILRGLHLKGVLQERKMGKRSYFQLPSLGFSDLRLAGRNCDGGGL